MARAVESTLGPAQYILQNVKSAHARVPHVTIRRSTSPASIPCKRRPPPHEPPPQSYRPTRSRTSRQPPPKVIMEDRPVGKVSHPKPSPAAAPDHPHKNTTCHHSAQAGHAWSPSQTAVHLPMPPSHNTMPPKHKTVTRPDRCIRLSRKATASAPRPRPSPPGVPRRTPHEASAGRHQIATGCRRPSETTHSVPSVLQEHLAAALGPDRPCLKPRRPPFICPGCRLLHYAAQARSRRIRLPHKALAAALGPFPSPPGAPRRPPVTCPASVS